MTDRPTDSVVDPPEPGTSTWGGPPGNARLTGSIGALIFVGLAAEGVTLLGVQRLIAAHVFIGMLLVPAVAVKTASTLYRFARYYAGRPEYVRRGPPPVILRFVGPAVVVTTLAVLATGIVALAAGPSTRWLVQAHKASFVIWFSVMTVHVLDHILETPALAFADWRRREGSRVPAARTRIIVVIVTGAVGLVLAGPRSAGSEPGITRRRTDAVVCHRLTSRTQRSLMLFGALAVVAER